MQIPVKVLCNLIGNLNSMPYFV